MLALRWSYLALGRVDFAAETRVEDLAMDYTGPSFGNISTTTTFRLLAERDRLATYYTDLPWIDSLVYFAREN